MRESKYVPIILETIGEKSASIGTLKEECGQGNKVTNIRKALHQLLKEDIIEANGYDEGCKNFSYDCIMLKKVDTNYKNPIYVKGLLDNPLEGENYKKMREIFKKRIEQINQIFIAETKSLEECIDKIPLKKAIDLGCIQANNVCLRERDQEHNIKDLKCSDVLEEYPEAMIWYFKKRFSSKLAVISTESDNYPYFGPSLSRKLDLDGTESKEEFVEKYYKSRFRYLPILNWQEHFLFRNLVIHALRDTEDRDNKLWSLASDLTEDGVLISFVSELQDIYEISMDFERDEWKVISF